MSMIYKNPPKKCQNMPYMRLLPQKSQNIPFILKRGQTLSKISRIYHLYSTNIIYLTLAGVKLAKSSSVWGPPASISGSLIPPRGGGGQTHQQTDVCIYK